MYAVFANLMFAVTVALRLIGRSVLELLYLPLRLVLAVLGGLCALSAPAIAIAAVVGSGLLLSELGHGGEGWTTTLAVGLAMPAMGVVVLICGGVFLWPLARSCWSLAGRRIQLTVLPPA